MLIRKSNFILGFPKRCGHGQGVLSIFFELTGMTQLRSKILVDSLNMVQKVKFHIENLFFVQSKKCCHSQKKFEFPKRR